MLPWYEWRWWYTSIAPQFLGSSCNLDGAHVDLRSQSLLITMRTDEVSGESGCDVYLPINILFTAHQTLTEYSDIVVYIENLHISFANRGFSTTLHALAKAFGCLGQAAWHCILWLTVAFTLCTKWSLFQMACNTLRKQYIQSESAGDRHWCNLHLKPEIEIYSMASQWSAEAPPIIHDSQLII